MEKSSIGDPGLKATEENATKSNKCKKCGKKQSNSQCANFLCKDCCWKTRIPCDARGHFILEEKSSGEKSSEEELKLTQKSSKDLIFRNDKETSEWGDITQQDTIPDFNLAPTQLAPPQVTIVL